MEIAMLKQLTTFRHIDIQAFFFFLNLGNWIRKGLNNNRSGLDKVGKVSEKLKSRSTRP